MKKSFLTLAALLAFGLASAQTDTTANRTQMVRQPETPVSPDLRSDGTDRSTTTTTQQSTTSKQRRSTTTQPRSKSTTKRSTTTTRPAGTTTSTTTTNSTNNNNSRGLNRSGANNPSGTSGSGNPTRP